MKIGMYSPYLDTLGGGEQYLLSLASYWSGFHDVCVYWDDPGVLHGFSKRFSVDVSKITVRNNVFAGHYSLFEKLRETYGLDLLFILTDGSVPYSLARKNIIHVQVPFASLSLGVIKKHLYSKIIFNSQFTLMHTDSEVRDKAIVIYPGVKMYEMQKKDEYTILSVGRFEESHTSKKQDVLIESFIGLTEMGIDKRVRLVLAGGLLDRNKEYFSSLRSLAQGKNIEFYPNVSHEDLLKLYGTSSIYWHAAGYGETDPKNMEHFGISTVEAMSAGCLPIVYNDGGLKEIVRTKKEGLVWNTEEELIELTKEALSRPIERKRREGVMLRARDFRSDIFFQTFDKILESL